MSAQYVSLRVVEPLRNGEDLLSHLLKMQSRRLTQQQVSLRVVEPLRNGEDLLSHLLKIKRH